MIELIITSTALIIVILTLRQILKTKISLRLQYVLWALVLIRLLIPMNLPQSPISVLNALATHETAIALSEPNAQTSAQEALTNTPLEIDNTPIISTPAPDTLKTAFEWDKLLTLVWYMGIGIVGLCLLLSNLHFIRILRKTRIAFPVDNYRLKVYVVESLPSPCLYGLFSPAVFITPEVAEDQTRLHHVLAHELCHYRHFDHIWSVLRSLCLAVYWFNPFVWVAAGVSRRDAELACDEATIIRLGEENRIEYGRTLIGLTCQKRSAMDLLCCATTMIDSKNGIQERIALIAKKPKTAVYTLAVVMLILTLTVGCTFTDAKPGEETDSAKSPSTATANSAQSPDISTDTLSHEYKIYDGDNPLSTEELQKATKLSITNVDSLDFLRDATNLTHLKTGTSDYSLSDENAYNVSGDINALSGLTKLVSVVLHNSSVSGDISSLSGLEKLQDLYLSETIVSGDISALNGLEKLKFMSLASDNVTGDLDALKAMSALAVLHLSGNGITGDLSSLSALSDLQTISLSSTPKVTGDISVFKGISLNFLKLIDTNISVELGDLRSISGLTVINLQSDSISGSLSDLSELSNLRLIYLGGKNITGDLSALSGITELEYVGLFSTFKATGDISTLEACANLKSIMLDDTNIAIDLSELSGFSDLTSITLVSPSVTGDISALSVLKYLTNIRLSSPNITGNLNALSELYYLTQLNLACPNIQGDLSALSGFALLSDIDVTNTKITGQT